jgi:hypothetical protein
MAGCGKVDRRALPTFPQPLLLRRRRQGILFSDRQVQTADLPLIVKLHQDGAGQAQAGSFVREDAHNGGAAVNFAIETLQIVGGAQLALVAGREGEKRQALRHIFLDPVGQFRGDLGVLLHYLGQVSLSCSSVRGIEDHAQIGGDLSLHALAWHILAGILLQVELAALPGDPAKDRQPSGFQSGMIVTDD